ncbi:hypothetical protein Tco_0827579 [Tanacetum coccineum]
MAEKEVSTVDPVTTVGEVVTTAGEVVTTAGEVVTTAGEVVTTGEVVVLQSTSKHDFYSMILEHKMGFDIIFFLAIRDAASKTLIVMEMVLIQALVLVRLLKKGDIVDCGYFYFAV